jgi:elongation factor Ts
VEITASKVKELRERSGAGMMECKKALEQVNGDIDLAIEHLRKTGMIKAEKKAGRVAAEGRIALTQAGAVSVLVEVNSETDFVAKDENFLKFVEAVGATAAKLGSDDVEALKAAKLADGASVDEARNALITKVGENVQVRRMARMESTGVVGGYLHSGKIGVLVELSGGDVELARGIAMHVAAINPPYLGVDDVPADIVAREKDIALAQVKDSGKPQEILEKMIGGKLKKTLSEMTLLGQAYVRDNSMTVEEAAKKGGATVKRFVRLAVGEGIEKKEENFADEVMKQAGLA